MGVGCVIMNTLSRTMTGIVAIALGLFLVFYSLFSSYWVLVYGVPILIIGVVILFNSGEDKIERVRVKVKDREVKNK
jgi:membrane-bound ClpP family serine protease|tara:strand:- start:386 stop:616 length:231 start_codon:yes stop_codon:yes gene_type:complete